MRAVRGPVPLTAGVATVSVGLLWLALARGWLGPDVGRGSEFCEAARDQLVRQPANTLSNLGFVVAGLLIARHVARERVPGSVLTTSRGTAYAVLVVLLGPGSAAMHASQSSLGGHLDTTSMYLFASFAVSYAITRHRALGSVGFVSLFAALLLACELVGSWSRPLPVVMFAGNLAFGALLVTALVLEIRRLHAPGPDDRPALGHGRPRIDGGGVRDLERGATGHTVLPAGLTAAGSCRVAPAGGRRGVLPVPPLRQRTSGRGARPRVTLHPRP